MDFERCPSIKFKFYMPIKLISSHLLQKADTEIKAFGGYYEPKKRNSKLLKAWADNVGQFP